LGMDRRSQLKASSLNDSFGDLDLQVVTTLSPSISSLERQTKKVGNDQICSSSSSHSDRKGKQNLAIQTSATETIENTHRSTALQESNRRTCTASLMVTSRFFRRELE
jgi:hypothetical protein